MTPFNALEYLKNRITRLSLNHKIGSRDIAELEVKEIVMGIEIHVIPTLEKALALLELYREFGKQVDEFSEFAFSIYDEIQALEEELK